MDAVKILVLTDLHMVPDGGNIIGLDPALRLRPAIDHINANHRDAACVVVTGDLAHRGDILSYQRLKGELDRLELPVHLLIGNHDFRGNFREVFGESLRDEAGFVQGHLDIGGHRLIFLDTVDNGEDGVSIIHSGVLCATRLAGLENSLAGAGERPVSIFMHHPPHATGFPGMDRIVLRNGDEFYSLVEKFGNVHQIIAGHVHRTISGSHRRVPFAIFKSPVHQQPMDFETADSSLSVDEPGAYGILLLRPEGVLVHSEDFEIAAKTSANREQYSY